MKVIITGGHHNSALVVAKALVNRGDQAYWFGHKFTMMGDVEVSAEYREVTQAGIPFYPIIAGKLQFKQNFLLHLARIPIGFIQNLCLLLKIRPNFIYSSGGYIALPTCVIAWLLRIPVFTHEQAVVTGLANRIIAVFAKRIYTAFPVNYPYPIKKTLYSGLPIRSELTVKQEKLFDNGRPTIYFTGGKQGSHRMNEALFSCLPKLLQKYNLIHQCGSNTIYNDFQKAAVLQKKTEALVNYYLPGEYYSVSQIGSVFQSADLVVSRAGAHVVYELLFLNKPCLLIPIPWTHNDEQSKNARFLVDCGLGKVLPESELNSERLVMEIDKMFENINKYRRNNCFTPPSDTVDLIINDIYQHLRLPPAQ